MGEGWTSPQCGFCRRHGKERQSLSFLLRSRRQIRRSRRSLCESLRLASVRRPRAAPAVYILCSNSAEKLSQEIFYDVGQMDGTLLVVKLDSQSGVGANPACASSLVCRSCQGRWSGVPRRDCASSAVASAWAIRRGHRSVEPTEGAEARPERSFPRTWERVLQERRLSEGDRKFKKGAGRESAG